MNYTHELTISAINYREVRFGQVREGWLVAGRGEVARDGRIFVGRSAERTEWWATAAQFDRMCRAFDAHAARAARKA